MGPIARFSPPNSGSERCHRWRERKASNFIDCVDHPLGMKAERRRAASG
jgi:hypothetical protein